MSVSDQLSSVILCGGKSRRMGSDKAKLKIAGTQSPAFLDNLVHNLSVFDDLWLSIGDDVSYPDIPIRKVSDRYPGTGPMGGLEAALTVCRHPLLFVTPVDMPFADARLAGELYEILAADNRLDAVLVTDGNNRRQHLLGIYRKSVLPRLTSLLEEGEHDHSSEATDKSIKNKRYRMKSVLDQIQVKYIPARMLSDGLVKTKSCNTQEEYRNLLASETSSIPVLSVTGWSGSGKTTFLEQLVPRLHDRGLRIAFLKHDAHHFEVDKQGKDSYRITRAGASMTGLFSAEKGVWMENRPLDLQEMLAYVHDVDLVLLEGGSDTSFPKILVYRADLGKGMRLDPALCLAVISDDPVPNARRQFGSGDYDQVAEYIINYISPLPCD